MCVMGCVRAECVTGSRRVCGAAKTRRGGESEGACSGVPPTAFIYYFVDVGRGTAGPPSTAHRQILLPASMSPSDPSDTVRGWVERLLREGEWAPTTAPSPHAWHTQAYASRSAKRRATWCHASRERLAPRPIIPSRASPRVAGAVYKHRVRPLCATAPFHSSVYFHCALFIFFILLAHTLNR